jgi:DltD protein
MAYYQKLREVGARYHAAVVDFADHDADRSFCFDYKGHLSPSGWVYYAQALDRFFHETLPPLAELPAPAAGRRAEASLPTGPAAGSRSLEPTLQDREETP